MKFSNKLKKKLHKIKSHKKKTRKNNKKNGGKFFAKGSFGYVYGNPSLKCSGEEDDASDLTVSKIFKSEDYATDEINVLDRLRETLSQTELDNLQQYAILPIKKCDIDRAVIKRYPYNTNDWKKDNNGKIGIFTQDGLPETELIDGIETPIYKSMIIQPKGGDSLFTIFQAINSDESFITCIIKLIGIAKAIQILQNKNFIHGDIKSSNCIEHDTIFKLIDMTDVRNIETTDDAKAMPNAIGYYIWPPTCVYTGFFNDTTNYPDQINLTQRKFVLQYAQQNIFNNNNYFTFIPEFLIKPFNITLANGFTADENTDIISKRDLLWKQKTFGYKSVYTPMTKENVITFIESLTQPLKIQPFLDKFNGYFQAFDSPNNVKLDIFKRVDIYSFGILINECIGNYIKYTNNSQIDENIRTLMINLYSIIYDCCIQTAKCIDFNTIADRYSQLIIPLISTYLPAESIAKYNIFLEVQSPVP
jgi:serine/threonine protein kinase